MYRENDMVRRYWSRFRIATKDHFYHAGARTRNRNAVVEALVCIFEPELRRPAPSEASTTG